MWAEKDRMKEGDRVRHSLSGEIVLILRPTMSHNGFVAFSLAPENFIKKFVIDSDEYWDVLE